MVKSHYATTLRMFACASYETIMLHRARWSHSAAQRWQYYQANCQHTVREGGEKGSNITTIR